MKRVCANMAGGRGSGGRTDEVALVERSQIAHLISSYLRELIHPAHHMHIITRISQ